MNHHEVDLLKAIELAYSHHCSWIWTQVPFHIFLQYGPQNQ